ncbi:MAG: excinuclease ABC subunit A [Actinobacteria bacterium]|nr:excinuclease ABC subunit A [Actinomycetota bacterium]
MSAERLVVRGAREHNLKNVSLDLPRNSLIVFTGLSGSGKSSLAFDTIFAEGQRRYVESLSAYARQFLGQMDKPDVDFIEGLSPAVSIDQKSTNRNPRSTVGTITEVYDYLRLLFSRAGKPHCPKCGKAITKQTPQNIVDQILALPGETRFQVLAPIIRERKGEFVDLFKDLALQGYSRARVDGATIQLTEPPKLKKQEKHTIEVVVDRLTAKAESKQRLTDSIETALRLAQGLVTLEFVDAKSGEKERTYSELLACHDCGISFQEMEPRSFSFNSPFGACPECTGIGSKLEVDEELVIPDDSISINEGAIAPWSGGQSADYFTNLIVALAKDVKFSLDTPWSKLSAKAKEAILNGYDYEVHVRYRNRYGRVRNYSTGFEGVIPFIERRHAETDSDFSREKYEAYMRETPCPVCKGTRLKPEVLAVTLGGKNIAQICELSIDECATFLKEIKLGTREAKIAERVMKEVHARLGFLLDVGLEYLTLGRAAATLSGGEAQRIRLATQIGSGLVGVLYVLDEPSIGLHQRDNRRLIETLTHLRDLGNTLIVVEHDEETIRTADWIVDIGPGAGEHGGEIVVSGDYQSLVDSNILYSVLANKLNGARVVPGRHRTISGIDHLDKVVHVDQSPIGRTPRSNPATYTGVFDKVRALFAETSEAKVRGYQQGRFSFNVKGGRCENCAGDGTITIEMNFLPDVYVPCEVCHGARYNRETLEVHYKGKTIAEVLDMPIEKAAEFFDSIPSIARYLRTLCDVGLGYVRLGQSAPTLSGGEAQRVKLATELQRRSTGRTIYVLDEPTTGLHFEDVRKLLGVLQRLVDSGNTVVVIEHNLDVIKSADWIIDLGPEGGSGGGLVIAEGTPETVAKDKKSYTGKFLAEALARKK